MVVVGGHVVEYRPTGALTRDASRLMETAPVADEPLLKAQRDNPRVQSGPSIEVPE